MLGQAFSGAFTPGPPHPVPYLTPPVPLDLIPLFPLRPAPFPLERPPSAPLPVSPLITALSKDLATFY